MTENFAECFIDLCCLSLTAERVTKLRLDHVKRGFDVAPLVVLLHEPTLVVAVVVIHATPEGALAFPLRFLAYPRFPERPHCGALFALNGMYGIAAWSTTA